MVDNVELAVYRTLASFSYKSSVSFSDSERQASNLYQIVDQFFISCNDQRLQPPDELLNLLALTVNNTLYNDQQRSTPRITDNALRIIYDIIKLICYNGIHLRNGINSTLFNRKSIPVFIFPGQPWKKEWQFVFRKFAFLDDKVSTYLSLHSVQHVVHNIEDVFTILQTCSNKVYFKGSVNEDFSGPSLCWFAPVPPPWTKQPLKPCDSLDPTGSRYGCYRFTLPFKILIQRFPTCFILGTRKYNQEHSHTILLTKRDVPYITLIEQCWPVKLTDTIFIRKSQRPAQAFTREESFEWCYFHDDPWTKWDQLEFAIATKDLQFDPIVDDIHLDFVDHSSKLCVPSLKGYTPCGSKWNKISAMQQFLVKLEEKNIPLDTLQAFFTDEVRNQLRAVQQSLRSTM